MHGQNVDETKDVMGIKIWMLLQKGYPKNETADLIRTAMSHTLSRNVVKAKTEDTTDDILCSMCRKKDETAGHVVAGSESLPQNEYNKHHDKVGLALQRNLWRQLGFDLKVVAT